MYWFYGFPVYTGMFNDGIQSHTGTEPDTTIIHDTLINTIRRQP